MQTSRSRAHTPNPRLWATIPGPGTWGQPCAPEPTDIVQTSQSEPCFPASPLPPGETTVKAPALDLRPSLCLPTGPGAPECGPAERVPAPPRGVCEQQSTLEWPSSPRPPPPRPRRRVRPARENTLRPHLALIAIKLFRREAHTCPWATSWLSLWVSPVLSAPLPRCVWRWRLGALGLPEAPPAALHGPGSQDPPHLAPFRRFTFGLHPSGGRILRQDQSWQRRQACRWGCQAAPAKVPSGVPRASAGPSRFRPRWWESTDFQGRRGLLPHCRSSLKKKPETPRVPLSGPVNLGRWEPHSENTGF